MDSFSPISPMSSSNENINSFVLADVCIFTGESFIEQGYVSIHNGVITRVSSGQCPDSAPGIPVISKPDHTLLPGLIDAHTHALNGNVLAIEQPLRFGVTTVCDMHNEANHIAKLKQLADDSANRGRYSDFKCAGVGAIVDGGWPEPIVKLHGDTPEARETIDSWPKLKQPSDAAPFVQEQIIQSNAEYIKLFHELGDSLQLPVSLSRPPLDLQKAVVKAAHDHGLIAVGHAFSFLGAMDLLSCGVDGLTHIFFDKPTSDEYISLLQQNKAHCNPTLSTCASQTREGNEMQRAFAADPLAQKALFDTKPRGPLGMGAPNTTVENAYENVKALYKAGIPLIVGSDSSGQARGTAYGLGVHMEIYTLIHRCGLNVVDALKGATSLTADQFHFNDRGRVKVGKRADLLLIAGDVREILSDEKNLCLPVRGVWRDGEMVEFWKVQMVE